MFQRISNTAKFLLFSIFLLIHTFCCASEGIVFVNLTWEEALSQAKSNNQLIFLDLYAEWCGPCKVMDNSVFSRSEIGEAFNKKFVNIRYDTETSQGKQLIARFGIKEYPTYLFINASGEIIHKIVGYHTSQRLLGEVEEAQQKARTFIPIGVLEQSYANGKREEGFLYDLINQKYELEGPQPEILNEFLRVVSKADLRTEKILKLIANNVTSVRDHGFMILLESLSSFIRMTEDQQKAILDGITKAKLLSFKEAVAKRDEELFEDLISAVHASSYSKEIAIQEERQFRYDFAKLTKNFKHFSIIAHEEAGLILQKKMEYFEELDTQKKENLESKALEMGLDPTSARYQSSLKALEGSSKIAASYQLNEFAYGFWQMTTKKIELQNALKWSAYSLKLFESPANWQTYALILKKVGRNKDAKKAIKRAIKLAKREGVDTKKLSESLNYN